ncbi:ABC transporter permease [Actinomadura sp. NEAU-AAG7]|uniref:ABC transporter permease n=1 Tax=Actinomadura sp. NEAU-AAG7 TaxID=2839640 RepID=UPI001BE4DDCF|nr:ABC transporter permease [Actinomadura sp. NEAU-AAG7]MBT2212943.1 ABC transporter permease [Actinomadura sp. NEAU-AAG7]
MSADVPFTRTLQAEWIKLRSLRSTWYTLSALMAVGIGVTSLALSTVGQDYAEASAADRQAWDPTSLSLTTYIIGQLIIGVLGILIVTSEYATGLIATSLGATPRRHRVLAAKAVIATGLALVAGQTLMVAAFLLGQAMMAAQDVPHAALGDDGVFAALAGGGLYLSAIALLAVGLGVITRATAGALATLVAIVFLVPALSGTFPSWMHGLVDIWPTRGAAAVLTTVPDPEFPHPWLNLGGLWLAVAAVLATAFVLLRRRDV